MSYSQPLGGISSSYTYPSPNPPHGNSHPSTNTLYAYLHPHQQMPGRAVAPPIYPNVAPSPYYPYAPPSSPSPPTPVPPTPMPPPPLPQQQPSPKGQVYAQQSITNPPNPKKNNKGKGNQNHKSQGNKGIQGPPRNAPKRN